MYVGSGLTVCKQENIKSDRFLTYHYFREGGSSQSLQLVAGDFPVFDKESYVDCDIYKKTNILRKDTARN